MNWKCLSPRLTLYSLRRYFTLLTECFSPVPRGTCELSVLCSIFSFGRNLPPVFQLYYQTTVLGTRTCTAPARATNRLSLPMVLHIEKKNSNSQTKHVARCSIHPWTHPSSVQCFYTLNHWVELFPFHSPLLRESCLVSFPPLINMLKFSGLPT